MNSDWQHGYFAHGGGYTYGYYRETAPTHLAWAARMKGARAPTSNFTYVDLGCGQGLNIALMAALHPDSQFIGIDFMPEHIANGRRLAERAGLKNVRFVEGDFVGLAADPESLGAGITGSVDYVVAHGIATWIGLVPRRAMFELAGKLLRPGGLVYNSYNTHPGWLGATVFQTLVAEYQKRAPTGLSGLDHALTNMERIQEVNGLVFAQNPGLKGRMENTRKQDRSYLTQEYNNLHWRPVYCAEMLDEVAEFKLSLVSTATLPELFDGLLPKPFLQVLQSQPDPIMQETVRDLLLNQSFRRDIYVKGGDRLWAREQRDVVLSQRFIATGQKAQTGEDGPYPISTPFGKLKGDPVAYQPVLDAMEGGCTLGEIRAKLPDLDLGAVCQVATLLVFGGWAAFEGVGDKAASQKFNAGVAAAAAEGAPYRYLAMPRLSQGHQATEIDLMLLNAVLQGKDSRGAGQGAPSAALVASLSKALDTGLSDLSMSMMKDGAAVTDPAQRAEELKTRTEGFLTVTLPRLQAGGAVR